MANSYVSKSYLQTQFSNYSEVIKDNFAKKDDVKAEKLEYTTTEDASVTNVKEALDAIFDGGVGGESGDENAIESISVNGTALTPDANKNVDITIPEAPIKTISQNGTALTVDVDGNVDITVPDTADFITKAVNDLENYYLKTETYTQTEVNDLISAIVTLKIEVVDTLPTTDISTTTIYLVANGDTEESNVRDEYICLDATIPTWEKIGSTKVDLSDYVKSETLDDYYKKDETYSRTEIDDAITNAQLGGEEVDLTAYVKQTDLDTQLEDYELADDITELSEDDIRALLNLSEEKILELTSLISDTEVRTDKTHSSSKIYLDLQQVLADSKAFTLAELAKVSGASYKVVTDISSMSNSKVLYLMKNLDDGTYGIYVYDEDSATAELIGDFSINLEDYTTKEYVDDNFALQTAFELLNNSIGDVSTLNTTKKTVVTAINELKETFDSANTIEVITEGLLNKALALPNNIIKHYRISTSYTGDDLPSNYYTYSVATVTKASSNVEIILHGGSSGTAVSPIRRNYYVNSAWSGWHKISTENDLANYLLLTGGEVTGDLSVGGQLKPSVADAQYLGKYDSAWKYVYSNYYGLYKNGQRYGDMTVAEEGTTDKIGYSYLSLGNNKATGTEGNAFGYINLYGTDTGLTSLSPSNNTENNISIKLPNESGTLALQSELGGYLPKNGGTIEKEAATLLTLKNTTETPGISRIAFSNSNGLLGCIGMGSSADAGLRRYTSDLSAGYTVLDTGNLAEYTKNSAIYANLQALCTAFGLEAKQYTTEELYLALPNNVNIVFDHYMLTDTVTVTDLPMNYGLVEIIKTSDTNRNTIRFTDMVKGNLYIWHYHETEALSKTWRKIGTTTVADVAKTNITYSNTANYAIATQEYNWYMVKNGICYYSLYVTVSTVSNTWVQAISGLPISTNTMISVVPPFADYASNPSGLAYSINNDGTISFRNGIAGNTYLVSGSYPVAE